MLEYVPLGDGEQARPEAQPTNANDKPELPKQVEPAQLPVPKSLNLSRYESWPSGGSAFFEDYEKSEVIDHIDGMTIEESDHTLATRLYQNTAKVHFDAHAAKNTRFGKRLIYGGHIISVARALSFNGLENTLGILAWNAGSHANPTFAGDTIYARSEVLDKAALPESHRCWRAAPASRPRSRTRTRPKRPSRSR